MSVMDNNENFTLINRLDAFAVKITGTYLKKERQIDNNERLSNIAERLVLDNVVGHLGTYEVGWAIKTGNMDMLKEYLQHSYDYIKDLIRAGENWGYDETAAQRGFHTYSIMYTVWNCSIAMRDLVRQLAKNVNVELK